MKCKDCNGTGADPVKTEAYQKTTTFKIQGGYVSCWTCNGNGLEPIYPKRKQNGP